MDEAEREAVKAGSTLVPVSQVKSKYAHCLVHYNTDTIMRKDLKRISVYNSRETNPPKKLIYKGVDYLMVNAHTTEDHPVMGDLVFVSHTDQTAELEAENRIKTAEGTRGEFKGDWDQRVSLIKSITDFIKRENKPLLMEYDGAMELK